jgi:hypothetical protein
MFGFFPEESLLLVSKIKGGPLGSNSNFQIARKSFWASDRNCSLSRMTERVGRVKTRGHLSSFSPATSSHPIPGFQSVSSFPMTSARVLNRSFQVPEHRCHATSFGTTIVHGDALLRPSTRQTAQLSRGISDASTALPVPATATTWVYQQFPSA